MLVLVGSYRGEADVLRTVCGLARASGLLGVRGPKIARWPRPVSRPGQGLGHPPSLEAQGIQHSDYGLCAAIGTPAPQRPQHAGLHDRAFAPDNVRGSGDEASMREPVAVVASPWSHARHGHTRPEPA